MAKELNDKELKNLNGGEGGILTRDTIDKLGLHRSRPRLLLRFIRSDPERRK